MKNTTKKSNIFVSFGKSYIKTKKVYITLVPKCLLKNLNYYMDQSFEFIKFIKIIFNTRNYCH